MGYRKTRGFHTLARTRLNRAWPRGFTEDGGSYGGYLQRAETEGCGGKKWHTSPRQAHCRHADSSEHTQSSENTAWFMWKTVKSCHKNTLFFSHVGDNLRVKRSFLFLADWSADFPCRSHLMKLKRGRNWFMMEEKRVKLIPQTVKVSRAKQCHLNLEEKQKTTPEGLPIILTRLNWVSRLSLPRFIYFLLLLLFIPR